MRTLSASLLTELGLTVTRPGYLVEIDFSTPLRLSTLGDITYGGNDWLAADVQVRGISAEGSAHQSGALIFNNTWSDFGALVLNEGVADRAIRVLAVYAGATADPVEVFNGVGDDAGFDAKGRLTINLHAAQMRSAFWPRARINAASGFTKIIPAGTRLTIGGQPYILERN